MAANATDALRRSVEERSRGSTRKVLALLAAAEVALDENEVVKAGGKTGRDAVDDAALERVLRALASKAPAHASLALRLLARELRRRRIATRRSASRCCAPSPTSGPASRTRRSARSIRSIRRRRARTGRRAHPRAARAGAASSCRRAPPWRSWRSAPRRCRSWRRGGRSRSPRATSTRSAMR